MGASKVGVTHLNILQLAAWNDEKISNIVLNVKLDWLEEYPGSGERGRKR